MQSLMIQTQSHRRQTLCPGLLTKRLGYGMLLGC